MLYLYYKIESFQKEDKMATIKDVAREAQVSVGTVSRFLNGEQLKPMNQQAIVLAIEKLGYEANNIARSMKTGRTMTVAVIVPYLANMFSMRVIESIEKELQKYNYCVIIADCNGDSAKELSRIEFLKSRQVDGIVLMPSGHAAELIKSKAGNIPLILIDRILDHPIFDSVIIDNRQMTYEHVKQLLEAGIRKIGILEGPDIISTAKQRSEGYDKALKEFGIEKEYIAKCKEYTFEEGYTGMTKLQKYNLDAVFASNYELSAGAVSANTQENLKILGFDTFDIPVRFYDQYTGIRQPIEEIGRLAANLLIERINNPTKKITNRIIK